MLSEIARIPLRKLFLVTVVIKIVSSYLAYLLSSPWILGFAVPLLVMLAYIALGFRRPAGEVSDERFGDSCYYLGFIFTISSIAFSLFDVPQLDQAGKLKEVAVRFGAAMVSTFLGFIVRVYLIGFRRDSSEALQSLEEQIIASANALQARLDLSREAFELFTDKIQQTAKDAETRVKLATEGVGQHLSTEMATALKAIATDVQKAYMAAVAEAHTASKRMADDLAKCSEALVADVNRSQALFIGLEQKLHARLDAVKYPDDFFTREMTPPVAALVEEIKSLGTDMHALKASVQQSAKGLALAMAKIEVAMEVPQSVRELVEKQETLGNEILAGMATTSVSLNASVSALKDQGAGISRILEEVTDGHAQQSQTAATIAQSAATLTQIGAGLATFQKGNQQIAEELGRLVKHLAEVSGRPALESQTAAAIAQSVATLTQISAGLASFQKGNQQIAEELGRVVKQLATLPSELRAIAVQAQPRPAFTQPPQPQAAIAGQSPLPTPTPPSPIHLPASDTQSRTFMDWIRRRNR